MSSFLPPPPFLLQTFASAASRNQHDMSILMITLQMTTMAMMMKTLMTMVSSVDENRFIIIVRLLPQSNIDEQAKAEKKQGSSRLRVILVAVMAIILMLLSI